MPPSDWLRRACDEAGGLSFARFMREALWHEDGYYASRVKIGQQGSDFFTAASSPLFGATIGEAVINSWNGSASEIHVCELGPGEGTLACSMAEHILLATPPTVQLHLHLYEPSPTLVERQRQTIEAWLSQLDDAWRTRVCVGWLERMGYMAQSVIVIANEVLDALPVERVRRRPDGWDQAYIVEDDEGKLAWSWRPAEPEVAESAARWLPIPVGTYAEICLEVAQLFSDVGKVADTVRAWFFDYGIQGEDWRTGIRPDGTLRSYWQHQLVDVLAFAGQADITTDVHWDLARHCADAEGFSTSLVSQQAFLLKHGILEQLQAAQNRGTMEGGSTGLSFSPVGDPSFRRLTGQFKQLALPGGMGERFSVLECVK